MAIEFDGTTDQGLKFVPVSEDPLKSLVVILKQTAWTQSHIIKKETSIPTYPDEDWYLHLNETQNGGVAFTQFFDTQAGWWRSTNVVITQNVTHCIVVTYDRGNLANDPLIYVDKVSVPVTEVMAPLGALHAGINGDMFIGGYGIKEPPTGILYDARKYDRILTQLEIDTICDSRGQDGIEEGLVWGLRSLLGAAGIQAYDGQALAGANLLKDHRKGFDYTPTISPEGYADDYLHIR